MRPKAPMRSGRRRRLKIDPTNRTRGSRPPGVAGVAKYPRSSRLRANAPPVRRHSRRSIISRLRTPRLGTARAWRVDPRRHRLRRRSRGGNHSGWATKERSWDDEDDRAAEHERRGGPEQETSDRPLAPPRKLQLLPSVSRPRLALARHETRQGQFEGDGFVGVEDTKV